MSVRIFSEQVRLLVRLLPLVARQTCFALKGGTAINLFIRDLPRLSVDIDLAYLPVADRDTSLAAIDAALNALTRDIEQQLPGSRVQPSFLEGTRLRYKLLVMQGDTIVKVEVTPVLRGCVLPPVEMEVAPGVRDMFGYARMQVLAFHEVYAGKICAALDRQHPRDLYDVSVLLTGEGITREIKDILLVYLLAHNRPIAELLDPVMQNISGLYRGEFEGMVRTPVSLDTLLASRIAMVETVRALLTQDDKQFLLSVKRGDPDWSRFIYPEAEHLPAVRWKLHNLQRMNKEKRQAAIVKLEALLFR